MKFVALCFFVSVAFGWVAAQNAEPAAQSGALLDNAQMTQLAAQLRERLTKISEHLAKFKAVGLAQIQSLIDLITKNRHCSALNGIATPALPTPSEDSAPAAEPRDPPYTQQEASDELHRLERSIAELEQTIARMRHVGKSQIHAFGQFKKIALDAEGRLCDAEEEEAEGDD